MADLKTQKNDGDVNAFIDSLSDPQRKKDSEMLVELMSDATGEKPVMWGSSIVGYGTLHYKSPRTGREGDWMRIGFSPRKANMTLYLMTGFDEYAEHSGYNPKPLLDKLGPYTTGKSCLYIKKLDDVNLDVLKQLVGESFKHARTI